MLYGSQGLTPSLTVELSQVGMLSPNYTVSVTRGEILHVGESISNLTLSGGDVLNNSSAITFTETVCSVHACTQSHKYSTVDVGKYYMIVQSHIGYHSQLWAKYLEYSRQCY